MSYPKDTQVLTGIREDEGKPLSSAGRRNTTAIAKIIVKLIK
jgi:hypothetical protein